MPSLATLSKWVFAVGVGLSLGLAATTASAADFKARKVKFGGNLAEGSPQAIAMQRFAKEVNAASGAKWEVQLYHNNSLGSDPQMQSALQGGVQEMAVVGTPTLVGLVKEFGVFDFPFLFESEKVADGVLDGPFGNKLLERLSSVGIVGLTFWENGFRNITNSRRAIEKLEDFAGVKLRVMQNPVALDTFKAIGANAVPMAFSELFPALETRTVDGQENPLVIIQTSKFYEVQKYLTLSRHVYTPFIMLASKKWWDGLTDDERKAVRDVSVAMRAFQRETSRTMVRQSLDDLKGKGMQINELSAAELMRVRDRVKPVVEKHSQAIGAATIRELESALADARK
jgi:tripartite ATP-independent transporter DctP family solute receptor